MPSTPTFKPLSMLIFGVIIAVSAQLKADIALDSGNFDFMMPDANNAGGFVVATSEFSLNSDADRLNTSFAANFFVIDAGIEIFVNGTRLFSTGNDVSHFGPRVFDTGLGILEGEDGNIENPFGTIGPEGAPLSRLTVSSDSTGTSFSGIAFADPASPVVTFTPNPSPNGFNNGADFTNISNFSNLLVVGNNTIEIVNLNNFQGANLAGDFTVTLIEATAAVPEPTSLLGLLALAGTMSLRRRRA